MRLLAAFLAFLAVADPLAASAQTLDGIGGGSASFGAMAEGQTRRLTLAARPGDYLRGRIVAEGGPFALDLLDAQGRHLRRLAAGVSVSGAFHFVAQAESLTLETTASGEGEMSIVLDPAIVADGEPRDADEPAFLSPTLAALSDAIAAGEGTGAFWQRIGREGAPLIERGSQGDAIVTFLARGAERNVRLFGGPDGNHTELKRLGASDVWYASFSLPATTRLAYRIAPDVPTFEGTARERRVAILATAQADPLNPRRWPAEAPDAFNQHSMLELPDAPEQPGFQEGAQPQGRSTRLAAPSAHLGNEREITLYRPAGFDPAHPRAGLLILFDGLEYQTRVPAPAILDALIAEKRIAPMAVVFVPSVSPQWRARELPGNPDFASFLADELLPLVKAELEFDVPAARTILAGSSYGGLAAVTAALAEPQAFGNALSLSGSFWWHPEGTPAEEAVYVASRIAGAPRADIRFHLSAGLFETGRPGVTGILETSRHVRDVAAAKGYRVTYREYAGGHDYAVWRGALADGLIALTAPEGADPW
ncbi:enterochelin esterase [Aureimonas populi]|uniref:Enterochelin esterase n=1 Tax=Aureimonas populi TaxID=1701758 RepID=A0ABW5CKV2_9HYPH|nr:enterochelin esterase [Aureimonas populi]